MATSDSAHDWIPSDSSGPDARVPLLSGRRLEMFKALVEHDNYYELSLMFPTLADDLQRSETDLGASSHASMQIRRDRTSRRAMCILLHTIPRELLKSLILGTVAFDQLKPTGKPVHYAADGPGAYVAAMAIEGRNGMWLNRDEIRELIHKLLKYITAYRAWKDHLGTPSDPEHAELDAFTRDIDTQYGGRDSEKPNGMRFISDDDAATKVELLREIPREAMRSFTSRYGSGLPNLITPPSTGLKMADKLWGLVCCTLAYMGKHPTIVVVPVIRTWRRPDLPLAEILTTMLGSALVTQDGFNAQIPGATIDRSMPSILTAAEQYVLALEPHLKDNLDASSREMEKRRRYLENMELVSNFPSAEVENTLGELRGYRQEIYNIDDQCAALIRRIEAETAELERQREAAQNYVRLLTAVNQVFRTFFGAEDHEEEDDIEPPVV
ncbi:hypothetical protein F4774DRAFT_426348 [Daldinia eschscholtzii]|nr:hypothetical protein F4774DRAFT_426348 [Daldinia eschscholtzii]